MDTMDKIGGACGDMGIDMSFPKSPLVYAQYYEYKLSHYLEKTCEGIFKYQSVLPGAFSILRWDAIKGQPIEKFLKGRDSDALSMFKKNMFLAEDRIMCWQMIVQKLEDKKAYGMMYLPGARAVTDP
jgi:chitin synthase